LEGRGVDFKTVVFIRNDIYEHLLKETPDKGKDTVVILIGVTLKYSRNY